MDMPTLSFGSFFQDITVGAWEVATGWLAEAWYVPAAVFALFLVGYAIRQLMGVANG